MKLFSYTIPIDDGAAPNPYGGVCTLAICKPRIRSAARKGDWIVGTGGKNVRNHDYSGKIVYAMRVDEVIPWKNYHSVCKEYYPVKIPDFGSTDYKRIVGDCLYYNVNGLRADVIKGVHQQPDDMTHDLGGRNVLLSREFYYFGTNAITLRDDLLPIVKQGQGHKSNANEPYVERFIEWIRSLGYTKNMLHGMHQILIKGDAFKSGEIKPCVCSVERKKNHNHKVFCSK